MDFITVEYSVSQGQFHVDTLDRVLRLNCCNAIEGNSNDYQLLAIFKGDFVTDGQAQAFIEKIKRRMADR